MEFKVNRNGELYHHGIKGMRWGEWNDETRARYNRVGDNLKNIGINSSNISNSLKSRKTNSKYKKIDLSNMTDEELRRAINRRNLENEYTQKFGEHVKTGKEYVTDILDLISPLVSITGSTLAIIAAISAIKASKG